MNELLEIKISGLSLEEFLKYVQVNRGPVRLKQLTFYIVVFEDRSGLGIRISVDDPEQFYSNPYKKCISLLGNVHYNIARYFIRENNPSAIYDGQDPEYSFTFKLNLWNDTLNSEETFIKQVSERINYKVEFRELSETNRFSNRSMVLYKTCGLQRFFTETFNLLMYLTGDNSKYHNMRQRLVAHELWVVDFDKLLDLGCGDGQFILEKHDLFLNEQKEQQILGVELDNVRSQEAVAKTRELPSTCKVEIMTGDITKKNAGFGGYDTVVMIEVIEHLFDDQLRELAVNLFENIAAKNIFISTPNSDYADYPEKMYDNGFRHLDHKFEWGKEKFLAWAKGLANTYQYELYYYPMGVMDNAGATASQMIYFSKL